MSSISELQAAEAGFGCEYEPYFSGGSEPSIVKAMPKEGSRQPKQREKKRRGRNAPPPILIPGGQKTDKKVGKLLAVVDPGKPVPQWMRSAGCFRPGSAEKIALLIWRLDKDVPLFYDEEHLESNLAPDLTGSGQICLTPAGSWPYKVRKKDRA